MFLVAETDHWSNLIWPYLGQIWSDLLDLCFHWSEKLFRNFLFSHNIFILQGDRSYSSSKAPVTLVELFVLRFASFPDGIKGSKRTQRCPASSSNFASKKFSWKKLFLSPGEYFFPIFAFCNTLSQQSQRPFLPMPCWPGLPLAPRVLLRQI